MPILEAEPALFPGDLFGAESPRVEAHGGRDWWVLHTHPRQEKSLARDLYRRHIPFYLPVTDRRSRVRGRILTSHIPLFTSYAFLLADRDERLGALATGRVVRALKVHDQAGLWHDLRQIHHLINSGAPVALEDRLGPGMMVEIRSGPLAGLKGKILSAASRRRFVVAVNFIQQGASVLLEDWVLVKCD
jgi:transcriptional antiterminator RfaH